MINAGRLLAIVIGGLLMVGCNQGSSSGSDAPATVTPLAYTGKTDAAAIDALDETQQNKLAVAATYGAAAVVDYRSENQSVSLSLLATVARNIGVVDLTLSARERALIPPNPCSTPQGAISYHAVSGRYLTVDFDQMCVPSFTAAEVAAFTDMGSTQPGAIGLAVLGIPYPPSEMPLTVSGTLFMDSQYHAVSADALTILDNERATVVTIPSGSFQLSNLDSELPLQGVKERLFLCSNKVCKVGLGYLDENAAGSYSSYVDSTCTSDCAPIGQMLYVPDLGKLTLTTSQLLPCSTNSNAEPYGLFQSGSLTLTGASGSLTVTYNGCGQPFTVTTSN
jgi:hypothetical protein